MGVPLGAIVQDRPGNQLVAGYDVALGTRYAPHPMFSIGLEAGATGLYFDRRGDQERAVTMIYGALVGSFYAGKAHHASRTAEFVVD